MATNPYRHEKDNQLHHRRHRVRGGAFHELVQEKRKRRGNQARLLTAGKWTLQRFEYLKKDGTWDYDSYQQKSFTISYEFREDNTAISIVGSSSSVRGWTLSGDQSQLTIARVGGGADTYNILQLTSSTLQLSPVGYSSTTYLEERDTYAR